MIFYATVHSYLILFFPGFIWFYVQVTVFNPLLGGKILNFNKLKAFADKNSKVAQMSEFVLYREENMVGIGENASYQQFLLFPLCFH